MPDDRLDRPLVMPVCPTCGEVSQRLLIRHDPDGIPWTLHPCQHELTDQQGRAMLADLQDQLQART